METMEGTGDSINYYYGKCKCGKNFLVAKKDVDKTGKLAEIVNCECGISYDKIKAISITIRQLGKPRPVKINGKLVCPKCHSESISPITENKLSPGGLLLGGILFGRKSVTMNYCMACGHKWSPR